MGAELFHADGQKDRLNEAFFFAILRTLLKIPRYINALNFCTQYGSQKENIYQLSSCTTLHYWFL